MGALRMTFIAILAVCSTTLAQQSNPPRVLLVTGVDHPAHDWRQTAPAIREILKQDDQFAVRMTDLDHAITRGLSDFQTDDELYIGLVGERPVELLATARSKVTGRDHPMAFAFAYGNGRVFHTPLGHDERALRIPGAAELLRRGCAWAAGRESSSAISAVPPNKLGGDESARTYSLSW
jgi:type 1 glutamine amidotransferase